MPISTLLRSDSSGILLRFGLLALLPVVALGAVLAHALNADVTQRYLESSRSTAALIAQVGVQPSLTQDEVLSGLTPAQVAEIDARLQGAAVSDDVTRIKVWSRGGTVVYSDNHQLIGRTFKIDDDLERALDGHSSANITDGHDEENSGDDLRGPLVQVYVPLTFADGATPSGAFELYLPYAPIQAAIDRESAQLYGLLAAGLALFYASMFPIVLVANRWRRRLAAAHAETDAERLARAEAERLNVMKTRFLATMSHELRTPLNSILGFAQLLLLHVHGSLNDRQVRAVSNIETSGRHLLGLINDVLDLSKIEAGKLELDRQEVRLDEVASAAIAVLQPLADQKGLTISLQPAPLTGLGDGLRLKQVLVNLLSNSVKFTPRGGQIAVRLSSSNGCVDVDVEDSGVGIPPAHQLSVFEDFVQAGAGPGQHEGTGLGLPISRRLMRLMNGELMLVSSSTSGSTFRMSVPTAPTVASQLLPLQVGALSR